MKLYLKISFLFIVAITPIFIAIWHNAIMISYFLIVLVAFFVIIFIHKLLDSNYKLKNLIRKNIYINKITNLPNRLQLLRDKKSINTNINSTLIIINIDSFQNTNNFYGHAFGDQFLKVIGEWLNANLPPVKATLYKFEADIYAILIDAPFSRFNLEKYLKKISTKITTDRITCKDVEIDTTLSIGAVQGNKGLMKLASIACKEAKNKRFSFLIYDESCHKEAEYHHNRTMSHILKEALAKDYVVPFFQPIFNIQTNQIEKFETLMRIKKTDGGYYSPAQFLDIAKHSKIYSKLSMALIQKAFETFRISSNGFSINLSYLDMTNPITTTFIIEKLEEFDVSPWVTFEILESEGIENYEAISKFINQIKSYGAKIAIDDFGAGYSNFERLAELRVDFIKIDGSLIKNIHINEETKIITRTIVNFAKELGIKTIAEYVHSKDVFDCVKSLGIDYAQGFYIGEPSITLSSHPNFDTERKVTFY